MYTPIRCQFTYSGNGRKYGYIATAMFAVLTVLSFIFDIATVLISVALLASIVATMLSYLPSLVWYYNQFSYRFWPAGHRYIIEFKNVEFIAVGELEVKLKVRGIGKVLKISFDHFSRSDRQNVRELFQELADMLKSTHVERSIKATVASIKLKEAADF